MIRPERRSLPQTLTRAVVKACAVTFALTLSYVSTAVVADMSTIAQGRQDDRHTAVVPTDRMLEPPRVSSEPGPRR